MGKSTMDGIYEHTCNMEINCKKFEEIMGHEFELKIALTYIRIQSFHKLTLI